MQRRAILDYIKEYGIEERIPYFGKARLITIPIKYFREHKNFVIPKEIFHFIPISIRYNKIIFNTINT
jgi:hypothetical protein